MLQPQKLKNTRHKPVNCISVWNEWAYLGSSYLSLFVTGKLCERNFSHTHTKKICVNKNNVGGSHKSFYLFIYLSKAAVQHIFDAFFSRCIVSWQSLGFFFTSKFKRVQFIVAQLIFVRMVICTLIQFGGMHSMFWNDCSGFSVLAILKSAYTWITNEHQADVTAQNWIRRRKNEKLRWWRHVA